MPQKNILYLVLDFLLLGIFYFVFITICISFIVPNPKDITNLSGNILFFGLVTIFVMEIIKYKKGKGMYILNNNLRRNFFNVFKVISFLTVILCSIITFKIALDVLFEMIPPDQADEALGIALIAIPLWPIFGLIILFLILPIIIIFYINHKIINMLSFSNTLSNKEDGTTL